MYPKSYNYGHLLPQYGPYHSQRSAKKQAKDQKSRQSKKKTSSKRKQSSNASTHQKKEKCQQNIKNQCIMTKIHPENQLIQILAQATTKQLYVKELQQKNCYLLNMINLLQSQIRQKDLLLDQCHTQISLLKHKFTQFFSAFNYGPKHDTEKLQDPANFINQNALFSKLQEQQQQIMRRIDYSEDTLKLSLASFSITTYEEPTQSHIFQESSVQLQKISQIPEQMTTDSSKINRQNQARTPLLAISNQNYQAPFQRKQSVSAITATHRLAAFYHKQNL